MLQIYSIWPISALRLRKDYSLSQKMLFFKQLHIILNSGISLLSGITLLEHRLDKKLAVICKRLKIELQSGKPLATAMSHNPDFFNPLAIALVAAGEKSGQLPTVLQAIALYYEQQKNMRGFLINTLIYPLFLIIAALGVMLFFLLYVIPILATTYSSMQAQPTGLFESLLLLHDFLQQWYAYILCVILALGQQLFKHKDLLLIQLLRIGWIKKTYYLLIEVRFCRLLALLINSGINIGEALSIVNSTIHYKTIHTRIALLHSYLQRGIDIDTAFMHTLDMFSPLTQELLALGASTGYLAKMLAEAAEIAENSLHERLEKLREFIAPALLLIAALLTAIIITSVMSPIFDLFNTIPEY